MGRGGWGRGRFAEVRDMWGMVCSMGKKGDGNDKIRCVMKE